MLKRVSRYFILLRYLSGFLIPLVLTGTLTFSSIWYLNDFVREKNAKIGDTVARQVGADLDEMLHETDMVILSYVTDLEFFKGLGRLFSAERLSYDELQLLRAFQGTVDISAKIRPYIYSIYCCPDTPVASAPFMVSMDGVTSRLNFPDRDFIFWARNTGGAQGIVVRESRSAQDRIMSVPLISKYSLVKTVDGRRIEGVLIVNLDRRYIEARLNRLVEERGDYFFFVTDTDSQVILASPNLKKGPESERTTLIAGVLAKKPVRFEGIEYLPISALEGEGGFTVHLVSSRSYLYATGRKLVTVNLFVILFSILAGIVILVVISRKKYSDIVVSMSYLENLENDGSLHPSVLPDHRLENTELPVAKPLKDYISLHLSQRELKERKLELELLRSQLNPHFLLNALQMLNWKIMRELKGYTDLNFIVENLSKILSYSLRSADKLARLEDEVSYTVSYVALQEYSRESRIEVEWELEDSMRAYLVPRLVFQPIIENAFKHAFPREWTTQESPRVVVKFERRYGDLQISISDNGIGMSSEVLAMVRSTLGQGSQGEIGIGLSNTDKRLQLLFGRRFGVKINSLSGKGTEVHLTIPMLLVEEN